MQREPSSWNWDPWAPTFGPRPQSTNAHPRGWEKVDPVRVRGRCSSFSQTTNGIPLASLPSHLLTAEVRMAPSILACVHAPAGRGWSEIILHRAPRQAGASDLFLACQARSACV